MHLVREDHTSSIKNQPFFLFCFHGEADKKKKSRNERWLMFSFYKLETVGRRDTVCQCKIDIYWHTERRRKPEHTKNNENAPHSEYANNLALKKNETPEERESEMQ